jgi:hypothetical protein
MTGNCSARPERTRCHYRLEKPPQPKEAASPARYSGKKGAPTVPDEDAIGENVLDFDAAIEMLLLRLPPHASAPAGDDQRNRTRGATSPPQQLQSSLLQLLPAPWIETAARLRVQSMWRARQIRLVSGLSCNATDKVTNLARVLAATYSTRRSTVRCSSALVYSLFDPFCLLITQNLSDIGLPI